MLDALAAITEEDFQATVVKLARDFAWIVGYTHDARKSETGEPGLRMVHPEWHRYIVAEVKTETGRLSKGRWNKKGDRWLPGQDEWGVALIACPGIEYYLWLPRDWGEIERVLSNPGSGELSDD